MSASRRKRIARHARTARVRERLHPSFAGELFPIWRRARELFLQFFDRHPKSITELADLGYVARVEHRKMCNWLHHLEELVRHLIITAALAISVTVSTITKQLRPRTRRTAIVWDNKPATWRRLHFSIFAHATPSSCHACKKPARVPPLISALAIARRLETLRRVLIAPEASARRAAFHLARLAAANRTSNQPRRLVSKALFDVSRPPSLGEMAVESALDKLVPICEDRMDAWNRGPEPG